MKEDWGPFTAKMTTLYNRRLQVIAIFMFSLKNNLLPRNILDLFTTTSNNFNLRNANFTYLELIPQGLANIPCGTLGPSYGLS